MKKWAEDLNFKKILFIFLAFRALDLLVIYLAKRTIPYLGFFPYKELINSFGLSDALTSLANFDGAHYLSISIHGYQTYEQAFFPLYPLLISIVNLLVGNSLLSAILISNFMFILGLYLLSNILQQYFSKKQVFWTIIFLISFPTSFFLGAVYTESLFMVFSLGALYSIKKKKPVLSFFFGILASLTRFTGLFLVVPIFFLLKEEKILKDLKKSLLVISSPIIGVAIYSLYLWKTTGDPFFFYTSQPAFGANRSDSIILLPQVIYRYIKIFLNSSVNFQYFVAAIEIAIFLLVFIILSFHLFKLRKELKKSLFLFGLVIFSYIQILLPTLTGTLSSIPRYALLSYSFFIAISAISKNYIKFTIAIIFILLHIILLAFFSQGYFIS